MRVQVKEKKMEQIITFGVVINKTPSKLKNLSNKVDFNDENLIEELIINFKGIEYGIFANYDNDLDITSISLCMVKGNAWVEVSNKSIFKDLEDTIIEAVKEEVSEDSWKMRDIELSRIDDYENARAESFTNNFSR